METDAVLQLGGTSIQETASQNNLNQKKKVFSQTCAQQEARVRKNSPYGHLLTWRLMRVIVKSNDDVRQEQFCIQLISMFD